MKALKGYCIYLNLSQWIRGITRSYGNSFTDILSFANFQAIIFFYVINMAALEEKRPW